MLSWRQWLCKKGTDPVSMIKHATGWSDEECEEASHCLNGSEKTDEDVRKSLEGCGYL